MSSIAREVKEGGCHGKPVLQAREEQGLGESEAPPARQGEGSTLNGRSPPLRSAETGRHFFVRHLLMPSPAPIALQASDWGRAERTGPSQGAPPDGSGS